MTLTMIKIMTDAVSQLSMADEDMVDALSPSRSTRSSEQPVFDDQPSIDEYVSELDFSEFDGNMRDAISTRSQSYSQPQSPSMSPGPTHTTHSPSPARPSARTRKPGPPMPSSQRAMESARR